MTFRQWKLRNNHAFYCRRSIVTSAMCSRRCSGSDWHWAPCLSAIYACAGPWLVDGPDRVDGPRSRKYFFRTKSLFYLFMSALNCNQSDHLGNFRQKYMFIQPPSEKAEELRMESWFSPVLFVVAIGAPGPASANHVRPFKQTCAPKAIWRLLTSVYFREIFVPETMFLIKVYVGKSCKN